MIYEGQEVTQQDYDMIDKIMFKNIKDMTKEEVECFMKFYSLVDFFEQNEIEETLKKYEL